MSREIPELPKQRQPAALPHETSSDSFWHSEPSPLLLGHRSTRQLPDKADVVIIGSGLTGAGAARHLLRPTGSSKGNLDVVMLEAREACWGATGRNGGHCQPLLFEHPHEPEIGEFELRNYDTLKRLIETEKIDCEWVSQIGVRGIYSQEKYALAAKALEIVKGNAPHLASMMKLYTDKEELGKYRIASAVAAMVTSVAARMWPYKLVSWLLEDLLTASDLKGSFNLQTLTPALSCESSTTGTWKVCTARGVVEAKHVILATNAYTSHLLPEFADLIVPCRGQMSALKPLPSLSGSHRLQTSMGFEGEGLDDYLIQRSDDCGGYLMFGGGQTSAPSLGVTDDSFVDSSTAAYLRRQLVTVFDLPEKNTEGPDAAVEMAATHEWTGIMGFSRDEKPWIGAMPGKAGVWIAAGFTGHGMPNTFLSGAAVASMVRAQIDGTGEGSVERARKETGLPKAYLVSRERIENALKIADVEEREQEEMERAERIQAVAGREYS